MSTPLSPLRATLAALLAALVCGPALASAQLPAAPGYHLDTAWKIGGDGGWDYLTFDPAARRLYVVRTDRVQVIDTTTGKLAGEVRGLEGGHGTALAPEFQRGFVSSGKSNTVIVFDLQTLQPIGEPIAVGRKPDAILYDPASKHVFAFDGQSGEASVLDAATGKAVATVALGGQPEFAVADGEGMVFVNLEDKSEILALDTRTNAVVHRWPLAPGEGPTGLSLDAAPRRLFVGCHNQQMIALDADSGKNLGSVPIGKGVDATACDPGTGLILASCGDGTLTVAQAGPEGFRVVDTVKTQAGARTMALDPSTHDVYLAASAPELGGFAILKFVR